MNKQLPRMDSIHELAQFWDTRDLTDFADELEEIIEPVFERQTWSRFIFHHRKQKR